MTATLAIDLKHVLEEATSIVCGDLVTRRTGKMVRTRVAALLDDGGEAQVAAIDFTCVRLLDLSCADEIVAKLIQGYGGEHYLLFCGVHDGHRDAIDPVLSRQGLAAVVQDREGRMQVVGEVPERVSRAFYLVAERGEAHVDDLAAHLDVAPDTAYAVWTELLDRRLARPSAEFRLVPIA